MADRVLWHGPRRPWADALGPVEAVEAPPFVGLDGASLVVLAGGLAGLEDWLRRPRTRPPVVVVAPTPEAEDEALRWGAEGVLPPDADPDAACVEARRARPGPRRARTPNPPGAHTTVGPGPVGFIPR